MGLNKSSLPKNRFEAFFDIITNQFYVIIKLGLLTFLFFLPVIITLLLSNIKVYEINLSLKEGLITSASAISDTNGIIDARNLLFLVLIPLGMFLLSGIFNIIRKLVWQEGILFWHDFQKGIKNNGLFFVIIGFILSLLFFLFTYTLRRYMFDDKTVSQIPNLIALLFSFLALVILFLMLPLLFHQTIIYNLKFIHKVKNACLIFIRMFYIYLPLGILNIVPLLILSINNGVLLLIFILLEFLLIIPLLIMINTFITDYSFDFFINYHNFKEIYRKGLANDAEYNLK